MHSTTTVSVACAVLGVADSVEYWSGRKYSDILPIVAQFIVGIHCGLHTSISWTTELLVIVCRSCCSRQ